MSGETPEGTGATPNETGKFVFRLYVAGGKPQSARALVNCKRICDAYLAGQYELEVIDIYQHPELAAREQILAVPALVKESPSPRHKMVGDLSDEARVVAGFGIALWTASSSMRKV